MKHLNQTLPKLYNAHFAQLAPPRIYHKKWAMHHAPPISVGKECYLWNYVIEIINIIYVRINIVQISHMLVCDSIFVIANI